MKTFIISTMMTLFITLGMASPNLHLTTHGQYLVINTAEWNRSAHTVKIVDQEGQVIYSKEFLEKEATPFKKFNLEKIPNGTYQIEVDDIQNINRQFFTKSATSIALNPAIELVTKPTIVIKGTALKVIYLNLDHKSTIKILDPTNAILFEGNIDTPIYNQQFNLSKLAKGNYTVVINQEKERFVQNIEL